jgi:hypothetical protein
MVASTRTEIRVESRQKSLALQSWILALLLGGSLYAAVRMVHVPLPGWTSLPVNCRVLRSAYNLASRRPLYEGPEYYLRFTSPDKPSIILARISRTVNKTYEVMGGARAINRQDVRRRRQAPRWLRQRLLPNEDRGLVVEHPDGPVHIYIYAWPVQNGTIVEVIKEISLP